MKNHYNDPTANTAVANADRDLRKLERRRERTKRTVPAAMPLPAPKAPVWRCVRFDNSGFIISDTTVPRTSAGVFLFPALDKPLSSMKYCA